MSPPHTRHDTADPAVTTWGGHGRQGLRQPSPEASKAFYANNTSSSSWGPALYICGTAESPGRASGTVRQGSTDRWARNELVQPPLCWRSPRPPAAELCHTHAPQQWRRVSRSHLWNLFVKAFQAWAKADASLPGSPCPCFLECNPGTLSSSLFLRRELSLGIPEPAPPGSPWGSPQSPCASRGAWGAGQTSEPRPCMLLGSSCVFEEFLFWGLDFLCSYFECSFLFYLFAH